MKLTPPVPPPGATPAMQADIRPKLQVRNLNFYYGGFQALKNVSLDIPERRVTAFIGPSGCFQPIQTYR